MRNCHGISTPRHPQFERCLYAYEAYGHLYAIAYQGKRNKPDWHYRFSTEERREAAIKGFFDSVRKSAECKAERQERKRQATAAGKGKGFEIGDILQYHWGYDQTNWEFFQVTHKTARTVTIQAVLVSSEGCEVWGHYKVSPLKDQFENTKTYTKIVQFSDDGSPYLSMDFSSARLWDGKAHYSTDYA